MNVYWLEQTEANVPAENDWLSAEEAACLNAMRFPKRRTDWRLGRWAAKCALSAYLNVPAHPQVFRKIEIRPAASGAPEALSSGWSLPRTSFHSVIATGGRFVLWQQPVWKSVAISKRLSRAVTLLLRIFHRRRASADCARVDRRPRLAARTALERKGERTQSAPRRASTRHPACMTTPIAGSSGRNGWRPPRVCYTGTARVRSSLPRLVATWGQHGANGGRRSAAGSANSLEDRGAFFRHRFPLRVENWHLVWLPVYISVDRPGIASATPPS